MACKDKSKEQIEKAKKACSLKTGHRWVSDSCSCDKKLIPDEEFKADSTSFARGQNPAGKYPIDWKKSSSEQSPRSMEFYSRYKGK